VAPGVVFWGAPRRAAIRSASELRLVVESADGLSDRCVSVRTESVACGVRTDRLDGVCVDPILEEDWRTRELSGAVAAGDRVELSLGVGLMVLDGLGAGVEPVDGWLDRDWVSRRRAAMRSAIDCRPVVLRSETLGDALSAIGLGDAPAPIRPPMPLVASELTLLRGDCKDLPRGELLPWDPIAPPIERSFKEGVRLGGVARTDGCDGVVVNDRF